MKLGRFAAKHVVRARRLRKNDVKINAPTVVITVSSSNPSEANDSPNADITPRVDFVEDDSQPRADLNVDYHAMSLMYLHKDYVNETSASSNE